jgi:hypothetical protein
MAIFYVRSRRPIIEMMPAALAPNSWNAVSLPTKSQANTTFWAENVSCGLVLQIVISKCQAIWSLMYVSAHRRKETAFSQNDM